jgi:hypothetical protein
VAVARECERLAQTVNDPVIADKPDPWRTIGEYAVALGEVNSNIDATRECQRRQRERLSRGK